MEAIFVKCHKCNGDGVWTKHTLNGDVVHDPCPVCAGEKFIPVQYVDLSIITDKLNDIFDKCDDILEKVSE